ncbi:hypothetical protein VP01_772g2 [Puccinia sorghi]|uniref:Uncharacterized protein n=1 Tax=Puccinia sorghi TaxID=27349 RepID=A0A0L6UDL1_9BASI|nr:hypothetical protein VP01_772g2 [Puccinia sorghi]
MLVLASLRRPLVAGRPTRSDLQWLKQLNKLPKKKHTKLFILIDHFHGHLSLNTCNTIRKQLSTIQKNSNDIPASPHCDFFFWIVVVLNNFLYRTRMLTCQVSRIVYWEQVLVPSSRNLCLNSRIPQLATSAQEQTKISSSKIWRFDQKIFFISFLLKKQLELVSRQIRKAIQKLFKKCLLNGLSRRIKQSGWKGTHVCAANLTSGVPISYCPVPHDCSVPRRSLADHGHKGGFAIDVTDREDLDKTESSLDFCGKVTRFDFAGSPTAHDQVHRPRLIPDFLKCLLEVRLEPRDTTMTRSSTLIRRWFGPCLYWLFFLRLAISGEAIAHALASYSTIDSAMSFPISTYIFFFGFLCLLACSSEMITMNCFIPTTTERFEMGAKKKTARKLRKHCWTAVTWIDGQHESKLPVEDYTISHMYINTIYIQSLVVCYEPAFIELNLNLITRVSILLPDSLIPAQLSPKHVHLRRVCGKLLATFVSISMSEDTSRAVEKGKSTASVATPPAAPVMVNHLAKLIEEVNKREVTPAPAGIEHTSGINRAIALTDAVTKYQKLGRAIEPKLAEDGSNFPVWQAALSNTVMVYFPVFLRENFKILDIFYFISS